MWRVRCPGQSRAEDAEPGGEHGEHEGIGMDEETSWQRKLMTVFLVGVAVFTFVSAALILFG